LKEKTVGVTVLNVFDFFRLNSLALAVSVFFVFGCDAADKKPRAPKRDRGSDSGSVSGESDTSEESSVSGGQEPVKRKKVRKKSPTKDESGERVAESTTLELIVKVVAPQESEAVYQFPGVATQAPRVVPQKPEAVSQVSEVATKVSDLGVISLEVGSFALKINDYAGEESKGCIKRAYDYVGSLVSSGAAKIVANPGKTLVVVVASASVAYALFCAIQSGICPAYETDLWLRMVARPNDFLTRFCVG
jgi:hypothetical protein